MLLNLSIKELLERTKKGTCTSEDILRECYENIERHNKTINAFITIIDKDVALSLARKSDKRKGNDRRPLEGIPFVMKDAYVTHGIRTTAASNILKNYLPQYNATVYQKLLDAGAILIGKMNMDAWGHGATNENSDFGPVKNPWDTTRVPGGSTGGVGAALAARMAVFGIGEDTGGSIRNPAAWCNITGLKVTYGRVSRYGCIAYASSFDTVGPMAKTAEDCAVILKVIAGVDPHDATSSPHQVDDYPEELSESVKNIVIAVPKELFDKGLDSEINEKLKEAISAFRSMGLTIKEISMPMITYGISVYYLIAPSETSSNLARYDGVRFGGGRDLFTPEGMRRIMMGTYALSAGYYDAYYKKAQQARTLFIKEYERTFRECDAIFMPVTPFPPTKIGQCIDDPIQNMMIDVYTTTQNPVGVPSLAFPCGFTKSNLPIGGQLVGKMFAETLLFRIVHAYQQKTDWHTRVPKL